MSDQDISGFFTDDENECGIPGLIYGRNFSDEEHDVKTKTKNDLKKEAAIKESRERKAREQKRLEEIKSERLKTGAKLIAGLSENQEIYQCLLRRITRENIDYAVNRYFEAEAVPDIYKSIIYSDDCIQKLVGGMLFKICRIPKNLSLTRRIEDLSKSILNNDANLIAYDRVGLIQRFIHENVDVYCGEGESMNLPVAHIRNLLSVSRLYLSLHDMNSKENRYYLYINQLSTLMAELEDIHPKKYTPTAGKNFYPKWRVRHLKPISRFFEESARKQIQELASLQHAMTNDEYRIAALNIYAARY